MASKSHQDILLMRWALFSLTGIILIVVLYSLGVTPSWGFALKAAMVREPFLLAPDADARHTPENGRSGRLPDPAGLLYSGTGALGRLL